MIYTQWVLPLLRTTWGYIEVRINPQSKRAYPHAPSSGNFRFEQSDTTQVLLLTQGIFTRNGITPFQKFLSRTDGKLSADTREFTFIDRFQWSGVTGDGAPVTVYAPSDNTYKTLLNEIFEDNTSLTTFFVSHVSNADYAAYMAASYADKTDLCTLKIVGDCTVARNTEDDLQVMPDRSPNSLQMQILKCRIDAGLSRASVFTVRELKDSITAGSHLSGPFQFVGGYIPNPAAGADFFSGLIDSIPEPYSPQANRHCIMAFQNFMYAEGGTAHLLQSAVGTINDGLHLISRARIIERCATLMDMSFDMDLDIITSETNWADFTASVNSWDPPYPAGKIYREQIAPDDGSNIGQKTGVIYEYLVGSDPRCNLNAAEFNTPVSSAWNDSIADIVKGMFPGCAPRIFIDQTLKRPRLRIISERILNTLAPTTITGTVAPTDTSIDVASLSFKGPYDYPFYAQIGDGSKGTEVVKVLSDNSGSSPIHVTRINTGRQWASGTPIAAVRMIPSKWRMAPGSRREATIISAPHVELSNTGDSDVLCSPNNKADGLKVEVRHRAKGLGPVSGTGINLTDAVLNSGLAQNKQANCWGTFTGGKLGRHIRHNDAVVTHTGDTSEQSFYTLVSASSDFSYLVPWDDRNASKHPLSSDHDAVQFSNGVSMGIIHRTDRNTLVIAKELADPAPPTGSSVLFSIGYSGYLNDIDTTDGSADIDPHVNLFGQTDGWGNTYIGQQLVIPSKGVFTIVSIDSTTGIITLNAPISGTSIAIDAWTGGPDVMQESWIKGAFLYYIMDASNKKNRFNDDIYVPYSETVDISTHWAAQRAFWRSNKSNDPDYYLGAYTICAVQHDWQDDGSHTPPTDRYGDSLYSAAQLFASLYLGSPVQLNRTYEVDDPSGYGEDGANGFDVMDSLAEYNYGTNRQFMAMGMEIDETVTGKLAPFVRLTLQEWPDFSAPLTQQVIKKVGNGSSGGASSGGSAGGGGASSGGSTGTPPAQIRWNVYRPAALTVNTNDYSVSQGCPAYVYVSSTVDVNLTGLQGGIEGGFVLLINNGSNYITLTSEDALSSAVNRFHFVNNDPKGLGPDGQLLLIYDSVLTRWRSTFIGT